MLQNTKAFIQSHKIISGLILVVIVIVVFFLFKKNTDGETRYVTSLVEKGNISVSVSGTGQVEASNTINLQTKTSGNINYVGVKAGDTVKKDKLIASVDSRDASLALENAKIALEKLIDAPDSLTLIQKRNSLEKSYTDGWNTVSSYVTDVNSISKSMYDLYSSGYLSYNRTTGLSSSARNAIITAEHSFDEANVQVEKLTDLYKTLSSTSSQEETRNLINEAYLSSKSMANAVKNTETVFSFVVEALGNEKSSDTTSTRADINSWQSSVNNYVNTLLSVGNSIDEGVQSYADLTDGADALDIKSAKLTVENKQAAYDNCFVYAPFDGLIATFSATVGDPSGSSIGTLITKEKVATISLNEVDIAKVKLGQKVTLTFDAIDGLTITGKVAEIDSVGTVTQGVVSYSLKISFDVDDDRIKPGMTVSAAILSNTVSDVLVVPVSAVKTQNGDNYVEVFDAALSAAKVGVQGSPSADSPRQVTVVIGLSDDTNTEIVSGLKEGDIVVTKTVSGTTTTAKTSTPSILNAVGGRGVTGAPRN